MLAENLGLVKNKAGTCDYLDNQVCLILYPNSKRTAFVYATLHLLKKKYPVLKITVSTGMWKAF
jgi:hypothetical protein